VGLIPARYDSTRLPGKALADICGKPMIQWVYERARQADRLAEVFVATDDARIHACVEGFGGRAVMTRPDHPTGTDRLAEAAAGIDADVVVNIQGDEPFVKPEMLDALVEALAGAPDIQMSTLMSRIEAAEELDDPSTVKVVVDRLGCALYFSRSRIPYNRAARDEDRHPVYKHLGLYAYRKAFLLQYAAMERTPLQRAEELEQLKVLENGYRIRVVETALESIGVDTERDLERARALMQEVLDGRA
jgi:3-deoxy-manno-octulosonate cytidylyltransferase (CMP-KDO synthetase)